MNGKRSDGPTDNCTALVALKLPLVPMLAAAIICVAHPQSIAANPAMAPIVFASEKLAKKKGIQSHIENTCHNYTHIRLSSIVGFSTLVTKGKMSRSIASTVFSTHGNEEANT
jgi:hypothetical protein